MNERRRQKQCTTIIGQDSRCLVLFINLNFSQSKQETVADIFPLLYFLSLHMLSEKDHHSFNRLTTILVTSSLANHADHPLLPLTPHIGTSHPSPRTQPNPPFQIPLKRRHLPKFLFTPPPHKARIRSRGCNSSAISLEPPA